jgi:divalent metal cation (Fe/Co/Zn/Cd) transporter
MGQFMGAGHSHDHAHSVDGALTTSAAGIRAVKIGLLGLAATAALQLLIVAVSGSVALFADTIHNFSDALTAVPLWIAFALGRRAATSDAAARDVFRRLLDGVDPNLIDTARDVLARQDGVESVRRVRMRWLGHRLVADAELDVDPRHSLSDAHRIAHDAEHALTHAVPKLAEATIHAYPGH